MMPHPRIASLSPLAASLLLLCNCTDATAIPEDQAIVSRIGPGELCDDPSADVVRLRFEPAVVVLAPGQRRQVRLVVEPDVCDLTPIRFDSQNGAVVAAPSEATIDYGRASVELSVLAGALGTTTLSAQAALGGKAGGAMAELQVEVLSAELPSCSSADDVLSTGLTAGSTVAAAGSLLGASIGLPSGADRANDGSFQWSVKPFETGIACADDLTIPGMRALGPSVVFSPSDASLPRDIPLSIPINPARLPETARLRHLRVAYSGPNYLKARTVQVTDPHLEKVEGSWRLNFRAPRLGSYQAMVSLDAGKRARSRRLSHRAIIGLSAGAAGAVQLGLKQHHLFDVVAGLGGPVDWSWFIDHLSHNQLAGFRPVAPGTLAGDLQTERTACSSDPECRPDELCLGAGSGKGKCTLMASATQPYEHASTFNSWWYEDAGAGQDGQFDRGAQLELLRDLALAFGNPFGHNSAASNLPAGIDAAHDSQRGGRDDDACAIYLRPQEGPDKAAQEERYKNCQRDRCANTQVLQNYFDDEFNPDGTFPVITFCDGGPQDPSLSPYANSFVAGAAEVPAEILLAVDFNNNGIRDELEPVIQAGHEPWDDWGLDQEPSTAEPGYGRANLDPAGDDYDPRYNPTGTEGDGRYQLGERFRDHGLDGVPGTADSPYDSGEQDGLFTVAPGLARLWAEGSRSLLAQSAGKQALNALGEQALARLDFWVDGGTRDLFNFAVAAEHFIGSTAARGRDGAVFGDLGMLPGLSAGPEGTRDPAMIVYEDLQGVVHHRYGSDDPNSDDLLSGNGQHHGSASQLTARLQAALYFSASRWPDAPRTRAADSADSPVEGAPECEALGRCTFDFTSSLGTMGSVIVRLPPGYGHTKQQHVRYPVVYLLHGFGLTSADLDSALADLDSWMNAPSASHHTRLGKAIVVLIDGRCGQPSGSAECIRNTFYADSARDGGPQMQSWWLELIDHIDQSYRTMPETMTSWRD